MTDDNKKLISNTFISSGVELMYINRNSVMVLC